MAQKQFIIDGGFTTNADSTLVGNLDITGHIIPSVDSDGTTGFDLGSPDMKWRDLYLSQGSLYIDGQKVIESNSGTIVVQADADQSLTTKVSGAGVMTLESATTVNMASTLQMQTGKKITDQGGNAVVFGDKVDMDNNQIINVGVPTADEHAATKAYVDSAVGGISETAITAGDSEVAIADLGTGTVGITVDGVQKLALSAATAAFTVPVTVNGATLANEAYADTAEADAIASAATDATAKADAALVDAKAYTDTAEATAATDATSKADQALVDAKAYADTAEADAVASAEAKDVARAAAAALDATTKADAAQAAAEATASADATAKVLVETNARSSADATLTSNLATETARIDAIMAASTTDADTFAEVVALVNSVDATNDSALSGEISARVAGDAATLASAEAKDVVRAAAAASDATTKANAALTSAQEYADTAEADAIASAEAKDVVRAAAANTYADSAEANAIASAEAKDVVRAATASADATAKADQALVDAKAYADTAEADAVSTASADATSKADQALVDAKAYADTAEADAVSTASSDATSKADQALVDAKAYADTAEADAVSTASADATSKADAALVSAKAYADTAEADAEATAEATAEAKDVVRAATASTDRAAIRTEFATADTTLNSAINVEKGRIDAIMAASTADADTFAEIVTLINSVDTTNDTALGTEISNRSSADTALSGRLDVVEGSADGSVAKAEADAIASAEAKDVVRAAAANTYADAAEAAAIASAEAKDVVRAATASADATAKADAAQAAALAALTHFHSAVQDVTSAQSATNASNTVNFTFSELSGAKTYGVYLNRNLLRPAEYSVSGTTVTIESGVIATDDELEVTGLKV